MTRNIEQKKYSLIRYFGIFITISIIFAHFPKVVAQSISDPWTEPINLSNSGSAINPLLVIDSSGVPHAIWIDEIDGYVYSKWDEEQWSLPVVVDFPFQDSIPKLVADNNGYIHAFWTVEEENDEEITYPLLYSNVQAINFADAIQWFPVQVLAESVLDMNVSTDAFGNLNLAYITNLNSDSFPSGVYFRKSVDGGLNWLDSELLYDSLYLRSLTPDVTNIQIATYADEGSDNIFVVWDNPALKRTYFIKSNDAGNTWDTPVEVDGPNITSAYANPNNIMIHPTENQLLMIWNSGDPDVSCIQYFVFSSDQGENWSIPQSMLDESIICPEDIQFISRPGNQALLFLTIQGQAYLLAWDGSNWSDLQSQSSLTNFVDSVTQSFVDFSCLQATPFEEDALLVIGCDLGEGQDVWVTSREIGPTSDWFLPPSTWDNPELLLRGETEFNSLSAITDAEGRIHLLWSQSTNSGVIPSTAAIFHSSFHEGIWSQPVEILISPEGDAYEPDIAIDSKGRLYVVWSGGETGETYFSWANSAGANIPSEWLTPQLLPSLTSVGSSPSIFVDEKDAIYVTYAIPLNEHRGIYLTKSSDGGETWSDPVQIFDAVSAGWGIVDDPLISKTNEGDIHVVWTQKTLPGGSGNLSIHYARSLDDGNTWSEAESFVESSTIWNEIVSLGDQTVHRLWQDINNNQSTLWHEISSDDGITWTSPSTFSSFGEIAQSTVLIPDSDDNIHLVQTIQDSSGNLILKHSVWDEGVWNPEDSQALGTTLTMRLYDLVATISQDKNLDVIYADTNDVDHDDILEHSLSYTSRVLRFSPILSSPATSTISPTEISTATLQPLVNITPSPTPQPTVASSVTTTQKEPTPTSPTITPTIESGHQVESPEFNPSEPSVIMFFIPGIIIAIALLIGAWIFIRRPR